MSLGKPKLQLSLPQSSAKHHVQTTTFVPNSMRVHKPGHVLVLGVFAYGHGLRMAAKSQLSSSPFFLELLSSSFVTSSFFQKSENIQDMSLPRPK